MSSRCWIVCSTAAFKEDGQGGGLAVVGQKEVADWDDTARNVAVGRHGRKRLRRHANRSAGQNRATGRCPTSAFGSVVCSLLGLWEVFVWTRHCMRMPRAVASQLRESIEHHLVCARPLATGMAVSLAGKGRIFASGAFFSKSSSDGIFTLACWHRPVNGLAVVAQGLLREALWVATRPGAFRPGVAITM